MADRPRSSESLRDIEQRIKRALELRGSADLDLGKVVVPVVLVHDATGPGWRAQIERAVMFADRQAPAALGHYFVKASSRPLAIDCIWAQSTTATALRIAILNPGVADPTPIIQLNTRFVERGQGADDVSPVLTIFLDDAAFYGFPIFFGGASTALVTVETPGLVLEPGGKIVIQQADVVGGFFSASFRGRLL